MRNLVRLILVTTVISLPTATFAGDTANPTYPSSAEATKGGVDRGAEEAVAAVDRFSNALATGRLNNAAAELAPDVVILEGGGGEWSAKEYLDGHAHGDAAFMKGAKVRLVNRIARIDGTLAWVGSESTIDVVNDGNPVRLFSAETMVLQRQAGGWKIVHIHWSSRKQAGTH